MNEFEARSSVISSIRMVWSSTFTSEHRFRDRFRRFRGPFRTSKRLRRAPWSAGGAPRDPEESQEGARRQNVSLFLRNSLLFSWGRRIDIPAATAADPGRAVARTSKINLENFSCDFKIVLCTHRVAALSRGYLSWANLKVARRLLLP